MRYNARSLMISVLICISVSGCGIVGITQIPNKTDNWTVMDPNDNGITKVDEGNGQVSYEWELEPNLSVEVVTIDYWDKEYNFINTHPVVKGQINGKTYPMIFDTGCSPPFFIQGLHISENDLPVFFFNRKTRKTGLATAKTIKSGSLVFENAPCFFFGQSPRWTILGIPFARERHFALGLPTLRLFKYCKFDQVKKQLQISKNTAFSPEKAQDWVKYPFEIKGPFLLVDVQLEGIGTKLLLDTGGCLELKLSETLLKKLYEKSKDYKKAWKFKTKVITPHMDREVYCRKFKAKNLKFGEQVLHKVEIISFPFKTEKSYDGVIGMEFFKKTVMVLDFEENFMWVKKNKAGLFN